MIRETLTAASKHAMVVVSANNNSSFQRRIRTSRASEDTPGPTTDGPCWVKVARKGNTFCGYVSTNGNTWTLIDAVRISMAENVYIGLAVTAHNNELPDTYYDRETTAHNNGELNTSILDNVRVTSGFQLAFAAPVLINKKRSYCTQNKAAFGFVANLIRAIRRSFKAMPSNVSARIVGVSIQACAVDREVSSGSR
jgi:hypothetical protein